MSCVCTSVSINIIVISTNARTLFRAIEIANAYDIVTKYINCSKDCGYALSQSKYVSRCLSVCVCARDRIRSVLLNCKWTYEESSFFSARTSTTTKNNNNHGSHLYFHVEYLSQMINTRHCGVWSHIISPCGNRKIVRRENKDGMKQQNNCQVNGPREWWVREALHLVIISWSFVSANYLCTE